MTRTWRIYTNLVFSSLFRVCWTLFNLLFMFLSCSWEWLLCKVVNPIQVSWSVSSRPHHLCFSPCLVCTPLTLHRRIEALIRDWTSTPLHSNVGETCTASTASKACMLCFLGHGGSQAQCCSFIGEQNIRTLAGVWTWKACLDGLVHHNLRLDQVQLYGWQMLICMTGRCSVSFSCPKVPCNCLSGSLEFNQNAACGLPKSGVKLVRSFCSCFAILGKVWWLQPALTVQKAWKYQHKCLRTWQVLTFSDAKPAGFAREVATESQTHALETRRKFRTNMVAKLHQQLSYRGTGVSRQPKQVSQQQQQELFKTQSCEL